MPSESPAPQPLPQLVPHEFRADGWPLCPGCGEDEVYSLIWNDGPRPSMDEFMAGALACYRCTWEKPAQPQPLPVEGQRPDCDAFIDTPWRVRLHCSALLDHPGDHYDVNHNKFFARGGFEAQPWYVPPAIDTPLIERCVEELPYGVCGEPERAGIHGNESPQNFDGYNHRFAPPTPSVESEGTK